ncbi:MAG TPA: NAD(P)/FAD-dependent oxidoreductase, partial [Candidatus Eremiobacteraceae bacterium]|nr:NAD(P)/FAD-dependent oxidoreductase [Candidatus Eremiobacteraceae bacterium]
RRAAGGRVAARLGCVVLYAFRLRTVSRVVRTTAQRHVERRVSDHPAGHASGRDCAVHDRGACRGLEHRSCSFERAEGRPLIFSRVAYGLAAGSIAGIALAATRPVHLEGLILGALFGALYGTTFVYAPGQILDAATTAAALAIPAWFGIDVIGLPVAAGSAAHWMPDGLRSAFPALVGWIAYAFILAALLQTFGKRVFAAPLASQETAGERAVRTRIIVLGGGFAGVTAAQALERRFGADRDVDLTLVSESNSLLFTPMLAEVAGGSLEPTHISNPIRSALRRTAFVHGRVVAVDPEQRVVTTADQHLRYDHLVLALGSSTNHFGLPGVAQTAFGFKTLQDAIRIRNHVIQMFERADRETDETARRSLLRFVIAGGGFAGVELAGALNDFARGMIANYPRLSQAMLEVVLVHGRERILPELSESLAAYALDRMSARGIAFRLRAHVVAAESDTVRLDNGESLAAHTLVWTAGTAPSSLPNEASLTCDKRGAVIVDATLAVPEHANTWALGDCAAVLDGKTNRQCPPTAQFAIREAETLAHNVWATIRRKPTKAFHFRSLGALCVIGYQTACAELALPFRATPLRFSGFFAWLLWRTIYVGKLPGIERKIRVLIDWTVELFFPRDMVQTIELQ